MEDISLRAFDEIVNPVLLCELDGKVIYKNSEAGHSLKKPSLGGKIQTYLSRHDRPLIENGVKFERFPTFVELESDGDLFSAFADVVYYEGALFFFWSFLISFYMRCPYRFSEPLRRR